LDKEAARPKATPAFSPHVQVSFGRKDAGRAG